MHFSTTQMIPSRDLKDPFGRAILEGDFITLKYLYAHKVAQYLKDLGDGEAAGTAAVKEIYEMRWGPTRVPIYNLILLSSLLNQTRRPSHLEIARWLTDDIKVRPRPLRFHRPPPLHLDQTVVRP